MDDFFKYMLRNGQVLELYSANSCIGIDLEEAEDFCERILQARKYWLEEKSGGDPHNQPH